LKCAQQTKIAKEIRQNPSIGASRSFKVIDVDKTKKPVISGCYNKLHVCTYLQPFLRAKAAAAFSAS